MKVQIKTEYPGGLLNHTEVTDENAGSSPVSVNCKYCNRSFISECYLVRHEKCCLSNPDRTPEKGHPHSEEVKKRISESRKRWLRENPEKHPWKKSDKFKSKPCETFKKFLLDEGIRFIEEYEPLEDKFYCIDIAFPDKKIGIEINGNQHYTREGILSEYYQERHNILKKAGWRIIEVHYTSCYDKKRVLSLIDKWEQPDYSTYFNKRLERIKKKEKCKNDPDRRYRSPLKNSDFKKRADLILSSGVDLTKFGWRTKVSKITGLTRRKIFSVQHLLPGIFIRKYDPKETLKRKNDPNRRYGCPLKKSDLEERVNLILNCGVDLTKVGWVSKVKKITNLTWSKIRKVINLLPNSTYIKK